MCVGVMDTLSSHHWRCQPVCVGVMDTLSSHHWRCQPVCVGDGYIQQSSEVNCLTSLLPCQFVYHFAISLFIAEPYFVKII